MQVSQLPNPIRLNDVEPGSLVLIPDENKWAICTSEQSLFVLEVHRLTSTDGAIADFGNNYRVTFELATCRRFAYPWDADGLPTGSLCLFPKNGGISPSIVLFRPGHEALRILDLSAGAMTEKTSHDGEGLSFQRWGIELQYTDELGSYKSVYEFTG